MTAIEILNRKADEWKALGEEMTEATEPSRYLYVAIEVVLRELAEALEAEREAA